MPTDFDVYPIPEPSSNHPLTLYPESDPPDPTHPTSAVIPLTRQLVSSESTPAMYIRITMIDSGCTPPSTGPSTGEMTDDDPTIALRVDGGLLTELSTSNGRIVSGVTGAEATPRIFKALADNPLFNHGVYLIRVRFVGASNAPSNFTNWEIQITIPNAATSPRSFTWVVANSEENSKHPWIDITSDTLNFDVDNMGDPQAILVNQSPDAKTITVHNRGTGPLTISGAGTTLGPFTLTTVPPTLMPNECGDLVFEFTSPTPGESNETYIADSDQDSSIASLPGHNKTVALHATARELEVMLLLDSSGSMDWLPDGTRRGQPGYAEDNSRWSELESAARQFLEFLAIFGEDKGKFGIVRFPGDSLTDPTSYDLFPPPGVSPRPANIEQDLEDVFDALDITPSGGTPMGIGIQRVLDAYFATDATEQQINWRWLILMSDGAHNKLDTIDPRSFIAAPTDQATPADPFVAQNIKLFTVGYGVEGKEDVDLDLLEDLKNNAFTGSKSRKVDVADEDEDLPDTAGPISPMQLAGEIRDAIKSGLLPVSSESDPGGVLRSGAAEARHQSIITPYDTKVAIVLNWNTPNADRMRLELLTPTCELITPESADGDGYGYGYGSGESGISFSSGDRYQIYSIDQSYLRNDSNPSQPRYGAWTLIVSSSELAGPIVELAASNNQGDREAYEYDVIVESRLRLRTRFDRGTYNTGDTINLSASLTLNGKPITNASVTLFLTAPGRSGDNFLATAKVSDEEFQQAAEALSDQEDINPLFIKAYAAGLKGLKFRGFENPDKIVMTDPDNQGIYRASIGQTRTPGFYTFYVVATGITEDGVFFRREKREQIRVKVRPEPEFTIFDIRYDQIIEDNQRFFLAQVTATPKDRFGNFVLADPTTNSTKIGLTAQGGGFTGPLVGNLDGSYTRTLRYTPNVQPVISLQVDGETVVPELITAPIAQSHYVDRVIDFILGGEAEPGANQHRDPQAALGDITTKDPNEFVSLGAFGALTVGIEGRVIVAKGDDDITVYVQPDEDLRRYLLEALSGTDWVEVGTSSGVTQSFSLGNSGIETAKALRITDKSGRTHDSELNPISTPGVSIRGIGVKQTSLVPAIANVIHIEAEDLDLVNYLIEDWDVASGGKVISLLNAGEDSGAASMTFTGPSGVYTIVVAYFDDIDGKAILRLKVNGAIVDSWQLDQILDPEGGVPTEKNFTRRTIGGVALKTGDTLSIEGYRDKSDWARVDFIELIPTNVI